MKYILSAATCLSLFSGAAFAQEAALITNPCDRGPVPEWRIINSPKSEFATFIQSTRPNMPIAVAEEIAFEVCDDLSLIGDNDGLTRRLNLLVQQSGY